MNLVFHSTKISYKIKEQGDLPMWLYTTHDLRLELMAVSFTLISQRDFHIIQGFFTVFKTVA